MPLPKPKTDEPKDEFIERCMSDDTMGEEYPDNDQRLQVCNSLWKNKNTAYNALERRVYDCLELRAADEGKEGKIVGHAAVFNALTEDFWGFREQVKKGAFKQSIKDDDIRALFNHDPNYVLGRNTAGTLTLREDKAGLWIENTPPDTIWARDLMISIERGDITQMSFAFKVIDESWEKKDGVDIRTLKRVQLFDVSPVTYPAYAETDVAIRSWNAWKADRDAAANRIKLQRQELQREKEHVSLTQAR